MFPKFSLNNQPKTQKKIERSTFQKWKTAFATGVCVLGFMSQKSVLADTISAEELIQTSRQNPTTVLMDESKINFLKSEPTLEEKKSIEELRTRLENISSKRILSTPEIKSKAQINPPSVGGTSVSGIEVINSDTKAYFLDKSENIYSDIITENTTSQIKFGVQKSVTNITNEVPITKGYQTTENFVVLQDEEGNYRSLFKQRSGYINNDGTLNTNITQTKGGQVNMPIVSKHSKDDIISDEVIGELQKPGRVSRDFFNQHGYVVQGKSFEQPSEVVTTFNKENTGSTSINVTNTLKRTHSTDNRSTIRESVRNYGYLSNSTGEANLGLNLLTGAIKSPLAKNLEIAKDQANVRSIHTTKKSVPDLDNITTANPKSEEKSAVIHSPEVLEELHTEQLSLREKLVPSILESRLSALKDQKKGSFIGVDIGTQDTIRYTTSNTSYRTKDSNFINKYRFGAETDSDNKITKLEINGENKEKEAIIGLYSSLDTQTYSVFNNQKITSYNQAELSAGLSGGIKSGPVVSSARIAVNHDQLNNTLYPNIQTRTRIGDSKHNINTLMSYSTNPGISNPNQIQLGGKTTVQTGKKSSLTLSGNQTLNLGNNVESYKTRTTVGLAAKLGGRVEVSSEWYLGSGDKATENSYESGVSDSGYLLQTVVKQNWGAIYANMSKLNETKKIGAGVVTKIKDGTIVEINYSHQRGYGGFSDDDLVDFKIRKNW